MEDAKIVALYLARDETALAHSSAKYGRALRSLGAKLISDEQSVEECENDTYFKAWNSIPPHEPRSYLFAFLAKIMRSTVLNLCKMRSAQRRSAVLTELSAEMEQCIPSPSDTECLIDGIVLGEAISRFLRTLTEEQRCVFLRRSWYFDSVAEISQKLGITESKTKSILFRTRNSLRLYLEKEGYEL